MDDPPVLLEPGLEEVWVPEPETVAPGGAEEVGEEVLELNARIAPSSKYAMA